MRGLKRKEPWEEETEWCCVCLGLRSRPLRSDETAHLSANTWSLTSGRPLRLYQHVSGFRQGLESLPLATSATKAFSSTCGIKSQILNFRNGYLNKCPWFLAPPLHFNPMELLAIPHRTPSLPTLWTFILRWECQVSFINWDPVYLSKSRCFSSRYLSVSTSSSHFNVSDSRTHNYYPHILLRV